MRAHRRAMIRHKKHADPISSYRVEQLTKPAGDSEVALELTFEDGATLRIVMDWTEAESLRHRLFAACMKD